MIKEIKVTAIKQYKEKRLEFEIGTYKILEKKNKIKFLFD